MPCIDSRDRLSDQRDHAELLALRAAQQTDITASSPATWARYLLPYAIGIGLTIDWAEMGLTQTQANAVLDGTRHDAYLMMPALVCGAMTALETADKLPQALAAMPAGAIDEKALSDWWHQHQAEDAARLAHEAELARLRPIADAARAKLSEEEFQALLAVYKA